MAGIPQLRKVAATKRQIFRYVHGMYRRPAVDESPGLRGGYRLDRGSEALPQPPAPGWFWTDVPKRNGRQDIFPEPILFRGRTIPEPMKKVCSLRCSLPGSWLMPWRRSASAKKPRWWSMVMRIPAGAAKAGLSGCSAGWVTRARSEF